MTELTLNFEKLHRACKTAGFKLKLGPDKYELEPIKPAAGAQVTDKITLRNIFGSLDIEKDDHQIHDNLAIALCTYFEKHMNRPRYDPDTEHGWGAWVEQKANEALDLVVEAALAQRKAE
jgi:hypothetical protein